MKRILQIIYDLREKIETNKNTLRILINLIDE